MIWAMIVLFAAVYCIVVIAGLAWAFQGAYAEEHVPVPIELKKARVPAMGMGVKHEQREEVTQVLPEYLPPERHYSVRRQDTPVAVAAPSSPENMTVAEKPAAVIDSMAEPFRVSVSTDEPEALEAEQPEPYVRETEQPELDMLGPDMMSPEEIEAIEGGVAQGGSPHPENGLGLGNGTDNILDKYLE